ncbi:hypothetical protein N9V76_04440 [Candidatus Poseidoniales archaeon]|nr:hypothetical protein [Candidatus Poseidoniales archaeon]
MNQSTRLMFDALSWTPLAPLVRIYRRKQVETMTAELRVTIEIDSLFEQILMNHSDMLS